MTEPLTSFLFWNVHKQPLAEYIAQLVAHYSVDVVLLAESPYWDDPTPLLQRINQELRAGPVIPDRSRVFVANSQMLANKRVQVLSRFGQYHWLLLSDCPQFAVWRLLTQSANVLLLATAHFPAPQQDEGDGQRLSAGALQQELQRIEPLYQSKIYQGKLLEEAPTVVVGDLNASPFDAGIAGCYGLHGISSRLEALTARRKISGQWRPYFYNPMWRFMGYEGIDDGHGNYIDKRYNQAAMPSVPGTFYYAGAKSNKPVWHGWYLLDQVLIRPSLLSKFDDRQLFVPRSDGVNLFVTTDKRRPKACVSDHLPLVFRLSL